MHAGRGTVQVPGLAAADIAVQLQGPILGQNAHGVNTGIGAVGEGEINNAILSAEGNSGLCHVSSEDIKAAALSSCQHHGSVRLSRTGFSAVSAGSFRGRPGFRFTGASASSALAFRFAGASVSSALAFRFAGTSVSSALAFRTLRLTFTVSAATAAAGASGAASGSLGAFRALAFRRLGNVPSPR